MKPVIKCVRLPQIEKDLKQLRKKFLTVDKDVGYIERLFQGEAILNNIDLIPGFGNHRIFKIRVYNTGMNKGKSDGYRLIFENIENDKIIKKLLIYLYEKKGVENRTEIYNEIRYRLNSPEYSRLQ